MDKEWAELVKAALADSTWKVRRGTGHWVLYPPSLTPSERKPRPITVPTSKPTPRKVNNTKAKLRRHGLRV